MTGRTHDLAAVTLVSAVALTQSLPPLNYPTLGVAIIAVLVGGVAPDLDQATGVIWQKLPVGNILGRIFNWLLIGGHRAISHSLVGIFLFRFLFDLLLRPLVGPYHLDQGLILWAFTLAYLSHLLMDSITREGVPWFWPFPFKIGFPPLAALRMKTGGFLEKLIVRPILISVLLLIYYQFAHQALVILRNIK